MAAAPLAAQSVKAGIEAWQRSDYSAAVSIWRPLAEKGDADAAFNLGQAYRLGRGVPTNLAAAQTWFERAAEKGHVDAQATLGLLLFQNGNQAGGLKWLKAAAEQGEPRALLVYGTALFNGDGVTQDPILGYAYVSRAAAQGLAPAKETLAQLDKLLPVEDRKKGVALAMSQGEGRAGAELEAGQRKPKAARTAAAKPSPKLRRPRQRPRLRQVRQPATGEFSSALSPSADRPRRFIKKLSATARWPGGSRFTFRRARSRDSRSARSPVARRRNRRAMRSSRPASRSPPNNQPRNQSRRRTPWTHSSASSP